MRRKHLNWSASFHWFLEFVEDTFIAWNAEVAGDVTVGDESLIGMGAVVLSGAVIGAQGIVGAGALVTEGTTFPPRSLIVGSPAKAIREIDDAMFKKMKANTAQYVRLARQAASDYREISG